jgi:hypothetical protein
VADENQNVDAIVREVKTAFDTKHDAVKAIAEKALAEAEKGIPLTETAKQLADEALTGMNEAKARLDEIEQKMARGGNDDDRRQKSPGQMFSDDEGIKSFLANPTSG